MTTTPPACPPPEPGHPAPQPGFPPAQGGYQQARSGFGAPSVPVPVQPGLGQPSEPVGPPAPPARRSSRALLAGLVAVLVPAVIGGAVWWVNRGEDGPLAGRPRVTDAEAGLSYAVPEDWRHDAAKDEDLIDSFSSQMTRKAEADGPSSAFMAGPAGRPVAPADLTRATETAARSNAEFFFPDQSATLQESRSATVGGRPAHTTVLRVTTGDGDTAYLEMTVVTVDSTHTGFLLGVTTGGAPQDSALRELDEITASADTVTAAG
ncbi:hypothetical protein [Streptomyces sp. NPDC093260]|uniref:hypothetical protein n=1 Tax=Streptomyces sp. NPDC093260 TaxID=3155073 RepID=UPI003436FE56